MAKCPACEKEIGSVVCSAEILCPCHINADGKVLKIDYDDGDLNFVGGPCYCPECHEEIFEDDDEGKAFLQSGSLNGSERQQQRTLRKANQNDD